VPFHTLVFNVAFVKASKRSHHVSSLRARRANSRRLGAIMVEIRTTIEIE